MKSTNPLHKPAIDISPATSRWVGALTSIFLFLLLLEAYGATLNFPFHFDDEIMIVQNIPVQTFDLASLWESFAPRFLSYLSFALNFKFDGLSTYSYHAVNLTLHFLTALMAYVITRRLAVLISENSKKPITRPELFGALVAMMFIAHPIQTQAVTYIWQRCSVLAAFFYLSAIAAYLCGLALFSKHERNATLWFSVSFFFTICSFFSKQNSATLPAVLIMTDILVTTANKNHPSKINWRRICIFGSTVTIPIILLTLIRQQEVADISRDSLFTPYTYFLTQMSVIPKYFKILFLVGSQNIAHSVQTIHSVFQMEAFRGLGAMTLLLLTAMWLSFRDRLAAYGFLFFAVTMLVESSFVPLADAMFEHRLYLPAFGLALAFSSTAFHMLEKLSPSIPNGLRNRPFLSVAVTGLLVYPLARVSADRNMVWETPIALWSDAAGKSPDNFRAIFNLAKAEIDNQNYGRAETLLISASKIKSTPTLWTDIARLRLYYAHYMGAVEAAQRTLELDPANENGHLLLARSLIDMNRDEEAKKQMLSDTDANPVTPKKLGLLIELAHRRNTPTLLKEVETIAEKRGLLPISLWARGAELAGSGEFVAASAYLRRAWENAPFLRRLSFDWCLTAVAAGQKSEIDQACMIAMSSIYWPTERIDIGHRLRKAGDPNLAFHLMTDALERCTQSNPPCIEKSEILHITLQWIVSDHSFADVSKGDFCVWLGSQPDIWPAPPYSSSICEGTSNYLQIEDDEVTRKHD